MSNTYPLYTDCPFQSALTQGFSTVYTFIHSAITRMHNLAPVKEQSIGPLGINPVHVRKGGKLMVSFTPWVLTGYFFCFVSLYSPCCPGTPSVNQVSLKFVIQQPLLPSAGPKCVHYHHTGFCFVCPVL